MKMAETENMSVIKNDKFKKKKKKMQKRFYFQIRDY